MIDSSIVMDLPPFYRDLSYSERGNEIGRVKLIGSRDIYFYSPEQIKRVRLVRRADGYYCQFCINIDVTEDVKPANQVLEIDVGLADFYTDSNGHKEPNPRFFPKGEEELKRCQRRLSRKPKGSSNRRKARQRLAKKHLRIGFKHSRS